MNEIDNDYIKDILFDVSKHIILPKFKKLKKTDIRFKNNKDVVTVVDIEVETKLKKILLDLIPNSLFVGEESYSLNPKIIKSYNDNVFCWTVDPIDGTKNYINGLNKFAIMIALTFKNKILQTWIYKPVNSEFSYAMLNSGTYINKKKFFINKKIDISKAIGSISSKYWDNKINIVNKIKNKFKNINSYGCIGLEYIDIVKEIRHFSILSKLSPWDHIPGILILKEAGGSILHFDKTTYNHTKLKNNLVISNSKVLQNEIINLIRSKE